jgi:hypothetical protein
MLGPKESVFAGLAEPDQPRRLEPVMKYVRRQEWQLTRSRVPAILLIIIAFAGCSEDAAPPPAQPPESAETVAESEREMSPANRALPSPLESFPAPPLQPLPASPPPTSLDPGVLTRDPGSPGSWTTEIVDVGSGDGRVGVINAVRVAQNPGFDRFVIEFRDGVLPGYQVEYDDSGARECGSGEAVNIRGSSRVVVRLQPTQAHDEEGRSTLPVRNQTPALPQLVELRMTCDFEAHVEWVLGVSSRAGFRVFELTEPRRIVIDLRH